MIKRLTQAPITIRLPFLIATSLIVCLLAASSFYFNEFRNSVRLSVDTRIVGISNFAVGNLENWEKNLATEIDALSSSITTREAMTRFGRLSTNSANSNYDEIRDAYINNNPHPIGERQNLVRSPGFTPYDFSHAEFHSHYLDIQLRSGFYDLFLILPDGTISYSVFKEDDFGTNLLDGPYADSGLADAFRSAMSRDAQVAVFSDFAPYAPSANQPASFLAEQVLSPDGKIIGVIAIQVPIGSMNEALIANLPLTTGDEVFLFGDDGLARTTSLDGEHLRILEPVTKLQHTSEALEGTTGFHSKTNGLYGEPVVAMTSHVSIFGKNWFIAVERDWSAAFKDLADFAKLGAAFSVLGAILSIIIGYFTARSITQPLNSFVESMERISTKQYDIEISGMGRKDELGNMSVVLDDFRQRLLISREAETNQTERRVEQSGVVSNLENGLTALAKGDLTQRFDEPFPDEYEELRKNFNETVDTMTSLMRQIIESSGAIRGRAEEISASSDDLSMRTESQAATLEETAAALDELTASVQEAAESASEVERVVTNARGEAEESGKIVAEAVDAMSMIKKSSNEISQIIGVIDDIAFQTNLLSLNAGVEAARAGDAGRGFAVVASEVRALAQRSSDAAKQIKSLINSSSEQVETGVGLVGRTGDALGSIIDRVGNIDTLMIGIAAGSREQSVGLGEINIGMSQLDQVTQQNAAMVEEATAAATTLKSDANALNETVSRFQIDIDSVYSSYETVNETSNVAPFPAPIELKLDEAPKMVVNSNDWKDF